MPSRGPQFSITLAGDVVEEVGKEFENTIFACQSKLVSTVHATWVGPKVIHISAVLRGDPACSRRPHIGASVLAQFLDLFCTDNCDLAVLTPDRQGSTSRRRTRAIVAAPTDGVERRHALEPIGIPDQRSRTRSNVLLGQRRLTLGRLFDQSCDRS